MNPIRKVAMIGCTGIDPVDTFSLAKNHWLDELILVGEGNMPLAATTEKLLEQWSLAERARVFCGSFDKTGDSAIAILNPFAGPCVDESPLVTVKRQAMRLKADIRALTERGFDGVMLIISEPVDVLAAFALRASRSEPNRVIGLSSNNSMLESVSAAKAGAIWCTGVQGTTVFMDQCDPNCSHFEPVMKASAKITPKDFKYSGNRVAGMALCVSRICEAILLDERELLPVAALLSGQYGISGTFITVPCIVGRNGIERIVELPIASAERRLMHKYAAEVIGFIDQLERPRFSVFSAV